MPTEFDIDASRDGDKDQVEPWSGKEEHITGKEFESEHDVDEDDAGEDVEEQPVKVEAAHSPRAAKHLGCKFGP